jgi:CRISPR/Cas system-associated endoribonuclease Cas2
MENTFTKKITFVTFVPDKDGLQMIESEATKEATFKELNRKDVKQSKLFWRIISLFEGQQTESDEDVQKIEPSTDKIADLTEKAIRVLLVTDENFTDEDKKEFLSDSIACINFGLWFLNEKCKPFFLKIHPS